MGTHKSSMKQVLIIAVLIFGAIIKTSGQANVLIEKDTVMD